MHKYLQNLIFVIIVAVLLVLTIRGLPGNPSITELNSTAWKEEGPLELSPDRGRFALLLSLVEDSSVHFSLPIAHFATPDLGYSNGHYVSLFAPGLSFIILPGYVLGKVLGASQVGAFAVIALFALLNAWLVRGICIQLKANPAAATLAGIVFLCATPAFAYAVSLYQHHISTFLIVGSIYILVRWRNIFALAIVWLLIAAAIPIDYPNLFLMLPVAMWATAQWLTMQVTETKVLQVRMRLTGLLAMVTVLLPLAFFMWFNQVSYGSPWQLAGTVASVKAIDAQGQPAAPQDAGTEDTSKFINPHLQEKSAVNFFQTRSLLNGLYIHTISPDRGILWYTPVILLGVVGLALLYKSNHTVFSVLVGTIGFNVLLYSMWGDPWGGWAFGSRYLIPTYAMLAIGLGLAISQLRRHVWFMLLFGLLTVYSLSVNTLGAVTSNTNPPKVEVLSIEKQSGHEEKYTYERNIDQLRANESKSFIYQTVGQSYLTAAQYYALVVSLVIIVSTVSLTNLYRHDQN